MTIERRACREKDYREKGTQCNYKTDQERSNSFKKRQRKNDLMCKNIKKYSNHIL